MLRGAVCTHHLYHVFVEVDFDYSPVGVEKILEHLERGNLYEACQLVHQWVQEYWLYRRYDLIFSAPSMVLHLLKIAWFFWNRSVPSACSWAVPIAGG